LLFTGNPDICHRMKRTLQNILIAILLIILAVVCADGAPPGTLRTNVTLQCDYPVAELGTNLTFKIYSSTNSTQAVATWPLYASRLATNTSITLPIDASQRYFVMTASNWWGESTFSNVAATPPFPRSDSSLSLGP
jgi:hypothetical protein